MGYRKLAVAALVGMTGSVLSPAALAQSSAQQGWYFGGSIGKSDIDESVATDFPLITSGGPVDGKDTGWKLFGGFMFNRNFGVELAYVDLGKASYSGVFGPLPVTGGSVEVTGFNVAGIAAIPVTDAFSLFGKLGIYSWEAEAKDTTAGFPFSDTFDGNDLFFGAGISYSFTRNLSLRGEWERFKLDDVDADLLSVGFVYRF
jgi:OmpA-OmpF porin, OOP family